MSRISAAAGAAAFARRRADGARHRARGADHFGGVQVNPLSLLGPAQMAALPANRRPAPGAQRTPKAATPMPKATRPAPRSPRSTRPGKAQFASDFRRPKLVFYSASGRSGCNWRKARWGRSIARPIRGIYLDTGFYRELADQLGPEGQFARDYVIAHEYGHHLQNLMGTSDRSTMQESRPQLANPLSVRLELQADCYAGSGPRSTATGSGGRHGKRAQRRAPDRRRYPRRKWSGHRFTHGSSAQADGLAEKGHGKRRPQRLQHLRAGNGLADCHRIDDFARSPRPACPGQSSTISTAPPTMN